MARTRVKVVRLSDLARLAGVPGVGGDRSGYCMVCGAYTEEGHDPKTVFRETFTEYNRLMHFNDVVCPYCAAMLQAPDYRRRSWIMWTGNIKFLTRKEALEVLLDPPEPPFFVYLTRTGKKHGWVPLAWAVAGSRDVYPVSWDGVLLWVDRSRLKNYVGLARRLVGCGARKSELVGGCNPRTWGKCRGECSLLERVRGDRLWELVAWLV